jgi:cytochrome c oxidase cbb3-type subunit 4
MPVDMMSLYSILSSLWVVWFTALFTGIVIWAFWPSRRKRLESHALIPFRERE